MTDDIEYGADEWNPEVILAAVRWDVRREGREWHDGEAHDRYQLTPEKIEMFEGKLLWSDAERIMLLGLLLENIGADRVVRLGSAQVWRDAVASLASDPPI